VTNTLAYCAEECFVGTKSFITQAPVIEKLKHEIISRTYFLSWARTTNLFTALVNIAM
jgi:hypothetical protein